jgi:protein SCO1/2
MARWARRLRSVGLWGGALALLLAVGCAEPERFASTRVDPPTPLPAFKLVSDGKPFELSALKGDVVVVYVGYTHCPDICPFTMGHLAEARALLPSSLKDQVKVVMISADPARDTPELMTKYVHYFDPTFIGVSGGTQEVLAALKAWGITPEQGPKDSNGGYTVTHPATSYVLNREGLLRLQMPHALEPEAIARDLKIVANEGKR